MNVVENMTAIQNICKEMSTSKQFSKRADICAAICLASAQSICWGKPGISLIELGVYKGDSLNIITDIAEHITKTVDISYKIYGFDSFEGLQNFGGYEDHHEIWEQNKF